MGDDFKDFERQIRRMLRRGHMDASTVLHRLGHMACSLAMSGAEEYFRAARMQMRRIDAAVGSRLPGRDSARVFREIHFYMICWDAIWKRLEVIKHTSGLRALKQVLKQYRVEATHYVLGRNELEHYVNWLRGKPKVRPLASWDHGNLAGRTFMLAGRQWDVSRTSLKRLGATEQRDVAAKTAIRRLRARTGVALGHAERPRLDAAGVLHPVMVRGIERRNPSWVPLWDPAN